MTVEDIPADTEQGLETDKTEMTTGLLFSLDEIQIEVPGNSSPVIGIDRATSWSISAGMSFSVTTGTHS